MAEPMQTSRSHWKNKNFGAVQSSAGNQHQLTQTWNKDSQRTTNAIYAGGGCNLQGNLVVDADCVFPQGPGTLRPLVGLKGAVGKGVLTIASFADMTTPTLTQRPAASTSIPGSTVLNGVIRTLRQDVQWGWGMGQRSRARCRLTSNGTGCTSVEVV